MTLYILKYNNYYNRILKREQSLQDYLNYDIYSASGVNFNPNDGVDTTHILGGADTYSGEGDYLVIADAYNNIISRWFIIDAQRIRAGQYNLSLRRDLFVDYWDKLVDAPAFIEKAIVPDSSPLIFNSENMSFNQIKTGELLIRDKTRCPWIVGYYAKNTTDEGDKTGILKATTENDYYDILLDVPFSAWQYNATETPFKLRPERTNTSYYVFGKDYARTSDKQSIPASIKYSGDGILLGRGPSSFLQYNVLSFNGQGSNIGYAFRPFIFKAIFATEAVVSDYYDIPTEEEQDYFLGLNGVIIKDTLGKYYKLTISASQTLVESEILPFAEGTAPFNAWKECLDDYKENVEYIYNEPELYRITGEPNSYTFAMQIAQQQYTMTAEELTDLETRWTLKAARLATTDAPYDIFAMPYGKVTLKTNSGDTIAVSNAEVSMAAANSIIETLGSNLYDIQLVPYCPIYTEDNAIIEVSTESEYSIIKAEAQEIEDPLGFILNVPNAKFSRYINLPNAVTWYNKKIDNECNMYKLCSPNWASEFQISVVKNNGIQGFDVDCEYKPFQPYIHVAPRFGGLYGKDFNDARGLVCSGDFSLSQIQNNWQQYQINNKNFQNIFDREIQNMEVQHKHQRIQQGVNILTGSLSGITKGAVTGAQTAGGIGAIAGGVIGGATSLAGGMLDYTMSERLRNEALDYKQDMFSYQLDNIQALPYTLTKVSAYNPNNKIFPVLEYYTCTETEKIALAKKIAYNSMSVGVIGTIREYLDNSWQYWDNETQSYITDKGYIKGQLIRIDDMGEDFHILNSLAGEFNKGVYTK